VAGPRWTGPAGPDSYDAMSQIQGDLFEAAPAGNDRQQEEIVGLIRARLRATLVLVKSAKTMPWNDQLEIIREDNAFRYGARHLPPAEGEALWAEFDAEMERLYAVMNEGKELDPDD